MDKSDDISFAITLKDNQWLKQKESTSVTLAQEGIIYDQLLGEGSYAKVISAYYKRLKKKVAVKVTDKRKAPTEYVERFLQREVNLLWELDHPNIVKLLAIFESHDKIFMVVEFCSGGDLLEYVNKKKYKSKEEIKKHFQQLSSAICYSHEQGIVHRDLKLENLVLDSEGNVKITDFGFARHALKGVNVDTFCGSFAYACPAILRGEPYNGYAADIWSMGIILYSMLTYRLPYNEADLLMFSNKKSVKKLKFAKDTPEAARDLIRRMLEVDPSERISAREVINHEWICQENTTPQTEVNVANVDNKTNNISTTLSTLNESSRTSIRCETALDDPFNDQENITEEKQFQLVAVRRSTVTSINNKKMLSNIVRTNHPNFANTVRKKKIAILCFGEFAMKKKEKDSSRFDKTKDGSGNDEKYSNLVSQVVKAKRKYETEEKMNEGKNDDCVKTITKGLQRLQNQDLQEAIPVAKDNSRLKLQKWKKVCCKLTGKAK